MARLFVGLQIPKALKTHLKRLQLAVPSGARVSRAVNWHLTLAFIGEADLALAKEALAAGAYNAPHVVLTAPGWFGRSERRTYWLGTEQTPSVLALHQAVHAALRAAGAHDAAPVVLAAPGWFGRSELRTYGLGTEQTPSLWALHQALHADLRAAGLTPDDKPFVPHITLARGRGTSAEEEYFRQQSVPSGLEFRPDEFCLYSSEPQPHGSVYNVEARYGLAGVNKA